MLPLKKKINKLLNKHQELVHTENISVVSHVQREQDDWVLNTIMLENIDVPFKYKRKKMYKSLNKQKVNITYYPCTENIAGFDIEIMNIVRIKISWLLSCIPLKIISKFNFIFQYPLAKKTAQKNIKPYINYNVVWWFFRLKSY